MSVKSDSKGRLTGADPNARYVRNIADDGTITYVPEVPKTFDSEQEVSREEFETFFGMTVEEIVDGGIQAVRFPRVEEGYFPSGLMVTRFVMNQVGGRVLTPRGDAVREKVFIRIKR